MGDERIIGKLNDVLTALELINCNLKIIRDAIVTRSNDDERRTKLISEMLTQTINISPEATVTHLPTGIKRSCNIHHERHKNIEEAKRMVLEELMEV